MFGGKKGSMGLFGVQKGDLENLHWLVMYGSASSIPVDGP